MLIVAAILAFACALLSVVVAYMIYQASQARQSHSKQLRAIQQRLAEKEADPSSPRPSSSSARKTLAVTRNSSLERTLGRIRNASTDKPNQPSNQQQSNTQQKH